MPYHKYESLLNVIMEFGKKQINLPFIVRLQWFKQMIKILNTLYTLAGMAHLDLKPDNVIVTEDFKLALIDFGHSNNLDQTMTVVTGTS
jgi:serine/threonine protein kinase